MRSGACTVQQTLTAEAASVLKHSLSLARRRGHGQVTPLHVAATLLSSRASLLRRACLKSQPQQQQQYSQTTSQYSHPLQCRALELCFNVALNRLPTTPGPILHGQPSLSNALVAALKRAQAHQRRGCIEQQQQQQPILTIKVELEQLIISILDDPSVSRVMREAGFSSTEVKNNIEDSSTSSVFLCYSTTPGGGIFPSPCSPTHNTTLWQSPFLFSPQKKLSTDSSSLYQDIKLVFEVFFRKRRNNSVIVGDCVSTTESLISELTARIERGDVPQGMKHVNFLKFYFSPLSLRFMRKEDVEKIISDLKRRVDSIACGGAIIYTGDSKWTVEENFNGEKSGYSAVDHLVSEIGRLVSDYSLSNKKVWLVATASYQTYLRCQMRQPPLEVQWSLQAVSVPSGGLSLSLHASSGHDSRMLFNENPPQVLDKKPFVNKEEHEKLSCCDECSSNYEKDVQSFMSGQQKLLPPWLHPHVTLKDEMVELRRKWNTLCHSLHRGRQNNQSHVRSTMYQSLAGKGYPFASSYPWWPSQSSSFSDSNSISFADCGPKPNHSPNSVPRFRRQNSCTIELNFGNATTHNKHQSSEPNLDSLKNSEDKEVKVTLALGSSTCLGTSSTTGLCDLLQGNLPWQSEIIPSIAEALTKKETWLPKNRFETEGGQGSCMNRAIFILTKSTGSSYEDVKMSHDSVIQMKLSINEKGGNKRKPEWGDSNTTKTARINEENARQSSFKILDLNMRADEGIESGEISPISSDITADQHVRIGFLELIKNCYVFNKTEDQYKEMKEVFMAKMKGLVEESFRGENENMVSFETFRGENENMVSFSVEERVLDGVLFGSSYFVNGLFEKWLKDIFQTDLISVKNGGGIDEI